MGGTLSLDVNVKARAKSVDTIMQYADGYIDFAIVPKDFEADVFELWADDGLFGMISPGIVLYACQDIAYPCLIVLLQISLEFFEVI